MAGERTLLPVLIPLAMATSMLFDRLLLARSYSLNLVPVVRL